MQIENRLPACPHCHIQPALVSQSTRRCTNCGKNLDVSPASAGEKGVIQKSRKPNQLVFAFQA